jgi:hypothetical protein
MSMEGADGGALKVEQGDSSRVPDQLVDITRPSSIRKSALTSASVHTRSDEPHGRGIRRAQASPEKVIDAELQEKVQS